MPTLLDKLWRSHLICSDAAGLDLLHVDRHYLTDLSISFGSDVLETWDRRVDQPILSPGFPDHVIATVPDASTVHTEQQLRFMDRASALAVRHATPYFERGTGLQGIVHVAALEHAMTLPGLSIVCGDSHTCTHGAVGALAWGIGSTEVGHVLATQSIWLQKPRQARVWLNGRLPPCVTAKDVILHVIAALGTEFGRGHAVEFAGNAVEAMSIEARATLCNMAIELGARFGLVAPDQTTLDYVRSGRNAPQGAQWQVATSRWAELVTDSDACFDKEVSFDVSGIAPQISWGITPAQTLAIDGVVPVQAAPIDALSYMGLRAGQSLEGVPVTDVFIGSCANSRIEDLRLAAGIVGQRRVAAGVRAIVVPGSEAVRRQAEEEGLDELFTQAGFEWRLPGCSMCVGINGDFVRPQGRCVSTSNRNFMGRQGPGARTHLASPATAAASALAGRIADPRRVAGVDIDDDRSVA